jgi:hypothetical protein
MSRTCQLIVAGTVATLALISAVPAGASAAARPDDTLLTRSVQGERAIDALGSRLEPVARDNGLSSAALIELMRTDSSAWMSRTGRVYFKESVPPGDPRPPGTGPAVRAARAPLSESMRLHSRPQSTHSIFLDFDGGSIGSSWVRDGLPADGHPAWSLDADPAFSAVERSFVQDVWSRVAEDFAPFDVDVTTEDPGDDALNRDSQGDTEFGTRVLISPEAGIADLLCPEGCGGITFFGGFDRVNALAEQPAWVFAADFAGRPKLYAEIASHEAGHTLGLMHDGTSQDAYYGGHDFWGPIMGVSYYRGVSQWSRGEYAGASNLEDDLAVMAQHGAPAIPDEAGPDPATAADLGPDDALITSDQDVDVWRLPDCEGRRTLVATHAPISPNLDLRLELIDATGAVLAQSDPVTEPVDESNQDEMRGMSARLSAPTAAGIQYARVRGVGSGTASTGYTAYGSIGSYGVTNSCGSQPAPSAPTGLTASGSPEFGVAVLRWEPAALGASAPVTDYVISTGGETRRTDPSARGYEWRGLQPGVTYKFSVRADSEAGLGPASTVSVVAATTPSPARNLLLTTDEERRELTVTWDTPESDGSFPVLDYVVWDLNSDVPFVQVGREVRSYVYSDVTLGEAARIAICPRNLVGTNCTNVSAIVGARPGAPTEVTASGVTGSTARLNWQPPEQTGVLEVTGYEVRLDTGPWSALPATARGYTFTGLVPGTAYTVSARATNGAGAGPAAATGVIIAPSASPPAPPTGVQVRGGKPGSPVDATVVWSPPVAQPGLPVTGYQVWASRIGKRGNVTRRVRSAELGAHPLRYVMPLTPGRWTFVVRARNENGWGGWTVPSRLVAAR